MDRRTLLQRIVMPAVALPLMDPAALAAGLSSPVSASELKAGFLFREGQLITAEDINLRFNTIIDMLFESDPDKLRESLTRLSEIRRTATYFILDTGEVVHGESAREEKDTSNESAL